MSWVHKCHFSAVFRFVQSSSLCEIYGPVMSVSVPFVTCILNQAEQLHPNFCNHDQGVFLCRHLQAKTSTSSRPGVLALHRHHASCLFFSASFCLLWCCCTRSCDHDDVKSVCMDAAACSNSRCHTAHHWQQSLPQIWFSDSHGSDWHLGHPELEP